MVQLAYSKPDQRDMLKGIKHVAIYVRKSRVLAGQDEYETLEKHRRELVGFAETNGLEYILFEEVETGGADDRKEFLRMLSLIENFAFDALLGIHVDRLLRNEMDKARLNKALLESDTLIIQTNPFEVINLSDESDYEKVAFRSFMAEFELRQIKRRFKAGKVRAALQGKWIQEPPYGYKIGADGFLEIVPEEAEIIHEMADRYINGEVPRTFAYDLNARGIPSPKGSIWRDKTIRVLLSNEVYIGTAIYGKARYPKRGVKIEKAQEEVIKVEKAHPAIFTMDKWKKIQKETEKRRISGKTTTGKHIYSGMLRCPVCEGRLPFRKYKGNADSNGVERVWVAKCSTRDALGNMCGNQGMGMYVSGVNTIMYHHLQKHYSDLLEPIRDNKTVKDKVIKDRKRISSEIAKLENAKKRILELYEFGDIDRRTYNARIEERDLQIDELTVQLTKLDDMVSDDVTDEEVMKNLEKALALLKQPTHDNEECKLLNNYLKSFIDRIYLQRINDDVKIEIVYKN